MLNELAQAEHGASDRRRFLLRAGGLALAGALGTRALPARAAHAAARCARAVAAGRPDRPRQRGVPAGQEALQHPLRRGEPARDRLLRERHRRREVARLRPAPQDRADRAQRGSQLRRLLDRQRAS